MEPSAASSAAPLPAFSQAPSAASAPASAAAPPGLEDGFNDPLTGLTALSKGHFVNAASSAAPSAAPSRALSAAPSAAPSGALSSDRAWSAISSLGEYAVVLASGQSQLQAGQGALQVGMLGNQKAISGLASNLERVAGDIHSRIDRMEEDRKVAEKKQENREFRSGARGQLLLYMHHFFDGSTGNNCVCPVSIVDHEGRNRELVVHSLPTTERFFSEECPNKMDPMHVRSFFTSSDMRRAVGLNYKDVIEALLHTGFKFLAVGPGWNQSRKRNMERFVIYEAEWYKSLLHRVAREMPDRPIERDFVNGGRLPNYRTDGVDYGFLCTSKNSKSTGRITQISKAISAKDAKAFPVMGEAWVREWYTPLVAKVFDIPIDILGVRHVVSSAADHNSALVKSHKDAIEEYRVRKSNYEWKVQNRKKKRAKNLATESKKKPRK